jgi:hypothetical protein
MQTPSLISGRQMAAKCGRSTPTLVRAVIAGSVQPDFVSGDRLLFHPGNEEAVRAALNPPKCQTPTP